MVWYQAVSEALLYRGRNEYFTLAYYVVDSNVNVSLRNFDLFVVTSPHRARDNIHIII